MWFFGHVGHRLRRAEKSKVHMFSSYTSVRVSFCRAHPNDGHMLKKCLYPMIALICHLFANFPGTFGGGRGICGVAKNHNEKLLNAKTQSNQHRRKHPSSFIFISQHLHCTSPRLPLSDLEHRSDQEKFIELNLRDILEHEEHPL